MIGARIEGDAALEIHGLSKIDAGEAGTLTFLANPKYTSHIYHTGASAVIVGEDFVAAMPVQATLLRVADPYAAFTALLEFAAQLRQPAREISPQAWVAPDAVLGEDVSIGAFACIAPGARIGQGAVIYPQVYVGADAEIGAGTVLHPQVVVYAGCRIGARCIVHAGARVGSDGFGFAPLPGGGYKKIPQTGIVVIEDEVEIGANTCIDRATLGETRICRGTKLDNLVQIAHNVEIGEHTVIAAQTGIAGSTRLGRGCQIGGQVGIVGHIELADGSLIDAQSGVNRSIRETGKAFRGSPVQPHRQQLKSELLFRKLEEMHRRIGELEARLAERD
ncbi:MAG: UDP-3-O-(3-hydroxymyristoyl)glucosamine N-acyltransferase [Bacteroidia bacterium]